jgi:hypothetical protein
MPLQLNTPDPAMDLRKRIVWDPCVASDVLEAQDKVKSLREQGFKPVPDQCFNGQMVMEPPARADGLFLMRVLDDNGDTRLVWNRRDQAEVDEARAKFDEYIKKGHRAYVCRSDGTKGRRVETFDSMMEELILMEKRAAEKHDASKGWGQPEAIMVPRTHPG